VATYRVNVRLTMEGFLDVEADNEQAADEQVANMDYSVVQHQLDLDFDEVDVIGIENLDEDEDDE
jgi:hypothetical protein